MGTTKINNADIQGNANVSRNINVGGSGSVKGNLQIEHNLEVKGWLEAKNIRGAIRGMYATVSELKEMNPDPEPGWVGLVGTGFPADIWMVESENGINKWVKGAGNAMLDVDMSGLNNRISDTESKIEVVEDGVGSLESEAMCDMTLTPMDSYAIMQFRNSKGNYIGFKKEDMNEDEDEIEYYKKFPCSTDEHAGLMSATDKIKLDNADLASRRALNVGQIVPSGDSVIKVYPSDKLIFPKDWTIAWQRNDNFSLTTHYFENDQVVLLNEGTELCGMVVYDPVLNKLLFNNYNLSKIKSKDYVILFTLLKGVDGKTILSVPDSWYEVIGDITLESANNYLRDKISKIESALPSEQISEEFPITDNDIIQGCYIPANKVSPAKSYLNYGLSNLIKLEIGDVIEFDASGQDIAALSCVLTEDVSADSDISSLIFRSLVALPHTNNSIQHIQYCAERPMYVTLGSKTQQGALQSYRITKTVMNDLKPSLFHNRDLEAAIDYYKSEIGGVSVDLSDEVRGKYISTDGVLTDFDSNYAVSNPIFLEAGAELSAALTGRGIAALSLTDEEGTYYSPVFTIDGSENISIVHELTYRAQEDCYIALSYRTITKCVIYDSSILGITRQVIRNSKAIAAGGLGAGGATSAGVSDWIKSSISSAFNRYCEWKGEDECLVFPILTDIHIDDHSDFEESERLKVIKSCLEADRLFGFRFIGHLGDWGPNSNQSYTKDEIEGIMRSVASEFGNYKGRVLFAQGNHDSQYYSSYGITQTTVGNYMMQPTINRFPGEIKMLKGHQCYYTDYDDVRIRVIVANTTDKENTGGGYGMSNAQIEWLIGSLSSVPAGYSVVILAHFCINKIGEWRTYISAHDYAYGSTQNMMAFVKIIEAFANKTSGSYSGYDYDFSEIDQDCRLIGYLCGDSHMDAELRKDETKDVFKLSDGELTSMQTSGNGVNYVITQGYGSTGSNNLPTWATHLDFNLATECLIDVVAICPAKRKFRYFRIGIGGATRDRVFSY